MSRVLIFTHWEISATFWVYCDADNDDNTSASSFHHTASSVQSWWTTDHLSNAPTIQLVDIGCSSRCILRTSSYISETLLLVLLKLLFIVWLFPVCHLWSSIVLKKQHKTKKPKTLFTLNPGIPGGPGGPGGQIAGHCRVQRQKTETSTASVCREHIFIFLQSHRFHKKHLPEGPHWDHEVYREDPKRLNNDTHTHKWKIRRQLL